MKSKDLTKKELKTKISEALQAEDEGALADFLADYAMQLNSDMLHDFQTYQRTQDTAILMQRGIRQLTTEETKFWQAYCKAVETGDVKQAFTGLDESYPESIVTSVFEGIRNEFPLLDAINFQPSTVVTKMILNTAASQLATWGTLGEKITKEISGSFISINLEAKKLSAFVPVSKDMIDAGILWIDAYVRAVLVEAFGSSLCAAVVDADGKNKPIGMTRDISNTAAVVDGVYPRKEAIKIKTLDKFTLGNLFAKLAVDSTGRKRKVTEAIFVVSPVDYYSKVIPAISFRNDVGEYTQYLPFPIRFEVEPEMPDGKAVIGIGKKYNLMGVFGGKTGKVDFSDEFAFLDDVRTYKSKLFADGRATDNSAFLLLDISELVADTLEVLVKNIAELNAAEGAEV